MFSRAGVWGVDRVWLEHLPQFSGVWSVYGDAVEGLANAAGDFGFVDVLGRTWLFCGVHRDGWAVVHGDHYRFLVVEVDGDAIGTGR